MAREYLTVRSTVVFAHGCVVCVCVLMASLWLLPPSHYRCDGDPGGMAITVDGVSMGHGEIELGPVPIGRSRIVVSIKNG
jgi:hypothetical protein